MTVISDEEEEKDPAWEVFCSPHVFILGALRLSDPEGAHWDVHN